MNTKSKGSVLFTVRRPKNILKAIYITVAYAMLAVLFFTIGTYERPYDDTDWPLLGKRSGLTLHIDYGTGCHWIRTGWFGSIQPRMNSLRKQVCVASDFRVSEEDSS